MQMLLALAVALLAAAVYLVGEVVTYPARERQQSLRRASNYGRLRFAGAGPERLRFRERVVGPMSDRLARLALRVDPRVSMESVGLRLLAAGMGRTLTPTSFLAAKAVGAGVGGAFGLLVGASSWGILGAFACCLLFALGGFTLPGVWSPGRRGAAARRSGRSSRTRSTCSRSVSRPGSASTAPSRS
jgi:hypothetical protein